MKKVWFLIYLITSSSFSQTLFDQNFNASSNLNDYIGVNTNQFDEIIASTGSTVAIISDALALSRNSGGSARFSKVTDLGTTINGMIFKFTLSVSGNSVAQTTAATLNIGNGYTTGGTVTNATTFAKIGINLSANNGEFAVRDVTNSTNGSNLTGTQIITWVLNTNAISINYLAPDNTTESSAANSWDLWAGTTKIFDDRTPQTATIDNLTNFKFLFTAGIATLTLDDFYTVGGDGVLPVELSSFSAIVFDNEVKLNWRTETEVSNYGFEILRDHTSTPLSVTDWDVLGFVEGYGNSNSPKEYSFIDDLTLTPNLNHTLRYRLKQIDTDGKFEYSKVIEVDLGSPQKFELSQNYPNPFNPSTTISFSLPESGNVKLTVYSIIGEQVAELVNGFKEAGVHTINFGAESALGGLNSGLYIYRIETNGVVQSRKMTLLK
jgi:hypothetical protein